MLDSSLEVKIHNILEDADIPFEEEYTFDDLVASSGRPLRFDFAIFDDDGALDFLIEAQGKQHYMPCANFGGNRGFKRQRYNDNQKKQYCIRHNIPLIAIPYMDEGRLNFEYIMRAAGYM